LQVETQTLQIAPFPAACKSNTKSRLCDKIQVSRSIASHEAKANWKLHALIPIAILQCLRKVNLPVPKNNKFR